MNLWSLAVSWSDMACNLKHPQHEAEGASVSGIHLLGFSQSLWLFQPIAIYRVLLSVEPGDGMAIKFLITVRAFFLILALVDLNIHGRQHIRPAAFKLLYAVN